MRDALIKGEWFEQIKNAPEDVQKELFFRVVKYGVFEEEIDDENDDWVIGNAWMNLKGHLIRMKNIHEGNIENGRKNGRKICGDPQLVYDYCQEHPKATVKDIGLALELPPKPSAKGEYAFLYENAGWKNRRVADWRYEEIPNSNEGIPKKVPNSENDFGNSFQKRIPKKNSNLENSLEIPEKIPFEF